MHREADGQPPHRGNLSGQQLGNGLTACHAAVKGHNQRIRFYSLCRDAQGLGAHEHHRHGNAQGTKPVEQGVLIPGQGQVCPVMSFTCLLDGIPQHQHNGVAVPGGSGSTL